MRKLLLAFLSLLPWLAHAQSYPQNVLPGSYSTTCPAGVTVPCWSPSSITNPLATTEFPLVTPQASSYGGAITQGGSWQMLVPAATSKERLRFFIENYCSATSEGVTPTESIFFTLAATQPTGTPMSNNAVELFPCGSYDTSTAIVGQNAIWIFANTTGHLFQASVWNAQ
jgi:hypothetical protein